jgi:hypothetical protein
MRLPNRNTAEPRSDIGQGASLRSARQRSVSSLAGARYGPALACFSQRTRVIAGGALPDRRGVDPFLETELEGRLWGCVPEGVAQGQPGSPPSSRFLEVGTHPRRVLQGPDLARGCPHDGCARLPESSMRRRDAIAREPNRRLGSDR